MRDAEGIVNKYNPREWESQQLQKTLFEEKRILIENCLFGADINPKSAEICRLRLWIELLKNAYFEDYEAGSDYGERDYIESRSCYERNNEDSDEEKEYEYSDYEYSDED